MTKLFAGLGAMLVACVLLAQGCGGPFRARRDISVEHDATVVAMDRSLAGWDALSAVWGPDLVVVGERSEVTQDGRLRVYVEFQNRTDSPIRLQVQTQFKDARGFLLPDQTSWENIIIQKRSTELYHAASLSNEAKRYVVRVMRP